MRRAQGVVLVDGQGGLNSLLTLSSRRRSTGIVSATMLAMHLATLCGTIFVYQGRCLRMRVGLAHSDPMLIAVLSVCSSSTASRPGARADQRRSRLGHLGLPGRWLAEPAQRPPHPTTDAAGQGRRRHVGRRARAQKQEQGQREDADAVDGRGARRAQGQAVDADARVSHLFSHPSRLRQADLVPASLFPLTGTTRSGTRLRSQRIPNLY